MARSETRARDLSARFAAIMGAVANEKRSGKEFADVYTLIGCLFFAIEKPVDPAAALKMRVMVKSMTHRVSYEPTASRSFQLELVARIMELRAEFPGVFPAIRDIGLIAVPESVLDELTNGLCSTPHLPHEPREWKRKIRLSKGA